METLQSVASDFLTRILADKASEVAGLRASVPEQLMRERAQRAPAATLRPEALKDATLTVIAEVKRGSPSAGLFNAQLDAASQAKVYADAGSAAVSVLTDAPYFSGSLADLHAVHAAVSIPILRKDFIIDPYQVWEARAAGADMLLLIAAALGTDKLRELYATTIAAGMTPFVEVNTEIEASWAAQLGAEVVGINNRDLHTFTIDLGTTARLRRLLPASSIVVALSGIKSRDDAKAMRDAGADSVLIGEALVRQTNPGLLIAEIRSIS